jgi:uncharacterized membrane protein YphA (DoxX/SURF4 family)
MAITTDASRRSTVERALRVLGPRELLGLIYLYAGIHTLADVGVAEFTRQAVASDATHFVPAWLAVAIAAVTPFVELIAGGLLVAGFRTRAILRFLAVLIVGVALVWGVHGLMHPRGATAMNIDVVNLYILPRAILIIILLLLPREDDLFALDYLLLRRKSSHRLEHVRPASTIGSIAHPPD